MDPKMTALLTEQLSERAAQDPLAALMLHQLSQQSEAVQDEPDLVDRKLDRAIRTINRLKVELAAANTMATHVGRVLGACPACWGLDHFCRQCLGSGLPGSRPPDIDAMVSWIAPALRRAGITVSSTRPATEQDGSQERSQHADS